MATSPDKPVPDPMKKQVTRGECLIAAASILSGSALAGRWNSEEWANYMSGEIRQLADRLYEQTP